MRENTSAPITSALAGAAGADHRVGHRQRVDEAAAHGLHVERGQPAMPSLCCRMQAADGNTMSGVDVATMIRSMSDGLAAGGFERVLCGLRRPGRCW
jgi:hypothetical protein